MHTDLWNEIHALCTGWYMLICEISYNTCSLFWLMHADLWNELQWSLYRLMHADLWNRLQYMLSVLADACWSVKWVTIHALFTGWYILYWSVKWVTIHALCTGWCMLICEMSYNTCSLYWLMHAHLWNRLQYMLSLLADTCWSVK